MSKILIVEDELDMLKGLQDNLEFEGYDVDVTREGQAGLDMMTSGGYDLVLLDIMLPDISGFEICKKVRAEGIKIPIILLTAKSEEMDKVRGLELGADDYITKPFSLRELLARVKAVLRRTVAESNKDSHIYKIGNLYINFQSYKASIGNEPVKISVKEVDVLRLLIDNRHQALPRDYILSQVWGIDSDITTRTVDNFIHRLRQKIEDDPTNPQNILTVHGVGYKLI
jgi:DNA-binding response OmpR family regulator